MEEILYFKGVLILWTVPEKPNWEFDWYLKLAIDL